MNKKYSMAALSMYLNYFIHGMGAIILAQNMDYLAGLWSTDNLGVGTVISGIGIGRLLVLAVSGKLSDIIGRKPFVQLGNVVYIAFFIGIILSPNTSIAFFFAVLAGIANSFWDSGTYPALMEIFPDTPGRATILIKAFMSAGQFLLPLMIGVLVNNNLWFGYSFVFCIAVLVLNLTAVTVSKFPNSGKLAENKTEEQVQSTTGAKKHIDGITFFVYGYISMATFYLVSQWLTKYGMELALDEMSSRSLMSFYSVGSITCVLLTSVMSKKYKTITFMLTYTFISFVALVIQSFLNSPDLLRIFAFVIGFSAAGGVMQLGLVLMSDFYPTGKGTNTGIYYSAGSIASFTIPLITGYLSSISVRSIMIFDTGIAAVGFLCAIIISSRMKKLKIKV